MNQVTLEREKFLVHQDSVIATVHLDRSAAGWSVRVFQVQRPNGALVHFGQGFAAGHELAVARERGIREAWRQIAEVLGKQPNDSGHTLHAVARPIAINRLCSRLTLKPKTLKESLQTVSASRLLAMMV
jgi:hypothetical protein